MSLLERGGTDMKRTFAGIAALLIASPLYLSASSADEPSMYERLGGYDAIAAVTDELIDRLAEEKFASFSEASLRKVRQNIVDFICEATGGPCFYTGRDIQTAHAGIGITQAQWDNFVVVFGQTMDDFEVPEDIQADFGAMMLPLEDQIVEVRYFTALITARPSASATAAPLSWATPRTSTARSARRA
jgi:hemoglobin